MGTDTKAVVRYIPTSSHGGMVRIEGSGGGAYVSDSDHERVVGELSASLNDRLMSVNALLDVRDELQFELNKSRAKITELCAMINMLTECLDDIVHERGGWATEEIINMGRDATKGVG